MPIFIAERQVDSLTCLNCSDSFEATLINEHFEDELQAHKDMELARQLSRKEEEEKKERE